jgi:CubicO group peptidase (beta-lactamase class C family)
MPRRMTIPACMAMLCNIFAAVPPTLIDNIRIARAEELPYRKTGQEKIDAIFAPLAGAHSPGMAVLVIKDGQRFFERGYGVRDLNSATKIDERTNFRLASCSKQFTAMATMLLVHDGKLRYGQKLTDIFPDFPTYGNSITIRDLLNHTAGLADYESLMEQADSSNAAKHLPPQWTAEKQIQDAEGLTLLKQTDSGAFSPGTKWAYSNSGYVMLGLIVAKVSDQRFSEFLRQRIFVPLKMDHTVAYEKSKNEIANRAYGHTRGSATWKETDQSSTSATLGDGGIYSSLEDLAKWDEALRSNQLLSKDEMKPALTPVTLPDDSQPHWPANSDRPEGTPVSYGFGWFLDPYRGHPRMWHYGETMGFHSYIVRFTNDNLTIVVLCNRTDLTPETLALKVADLLLSPSEAKSAHD